MAYLDFNACQLSVDKEGKIPKVGENLGGW